MAKAAKEYAKALFSSLKSSDDKTEALSFLRGLSEALTQDPKFMDQLKSKALSSEGAKKSIMALLDSLKAGEYMHNFFRLLIDKGRMEIVHDLASEFEDLMDEENGVLRGVVKSAIPIGPDKRAELEEKFGKKMNKKIILTYQQDERVVAGVKVEVGAFTFDDTVETHIKKIKENLNRSWS
jgi:F-type H+-transporting ATPase subunit delta